ncbi:methionyl-tRNA formyltransferase [bacterium]|nr:methionyl-tRNA formyltransferase [bacterium]
MLRTIFMGSPQFAVASLERVHAESELMAVYTQPDKPRARGNKMLPTPVKARALELGLPVHEPARIRDEHVLEHLKELNPDVILVVAYAKLIPKTLLDLPRFGCINVHPSLLPRYRGAIPIQAAIMNGDSETGVCTFFMDVGYDTGDIISVRRSPIGPDETGEQLSQRLSLVGADLLSETMRSLEAGDYTRTAQPAEAEGGYTKPLAKQDLVIDWNWPGRRVSHFVRALATEPGAQTQFSGGVLKVGKAGTAESAASGAPGTVLGPVKGKGFLVAAADGSVLVEEVKPAGKGWMPAWSFWQGNALRPGDILGGVSPAATTC